MDNIFILTTIREVLLDLFEEGFDLPAMTVLLCDSACQQRKVVDQKHQATVCILVEEAYPPKIFFGIILPGIEAPRDYDLTALQTGVWRYEEA